MALRTGSYLWKNTYKMNHTEKYAKKNTSCTNEEDMQSGEHTSLLFAMQSAFREKLAMKMQAKQTSSFKSKPNDHGSSLMQAYEKSQNLVKRYNKKHHVNAHRESSAGAVNQMRKLPPISQRNKSHTHTGNYIEHNVSKRKNSDNEYAFNHPTLHAPKNTSGTQPLRPLKSYNQNSVNGENPFNKLKEIHNHVVSDDNHSPPPNMSKLRMLSNRRKQELLKMNAKWPSDNLNADKSSQKTLSDFQKWQLEQDKAKQTRLEQYRRKKEQTHRTGIVQNSSALTLKVSDNHNSPWGNDISLSKNAKYSKQQKSSVPLSHPMGNHTFDDIGYNDKSGFEPHKTSLKQADFSELSNHAISMQHFQQNSPLMPGLQKPVLVRHDNRSTTSSRTSNRNVNFTSNKTVNHVVDMENDAINPTSLYDSDTQGIPEQEEIHLIPCRICGRKFKDDRLSKHVAVCAKTSSKKRRVFNMTQARRKGTDLEAFTLVKGAANSKQSKPRKTSWRNQHEDFIKTIRHAKMVASYVAGGGDIADLPPPEPSANPDYVTCQYCQRRFAPKVAERHIPKCKDIKSRPSPPKPKLTRRKR